MVHRRQRSQIRHSLAAVSSNSLQVEVKGEALTNSAPTGLPGIVDQANPGDTLTTVRPGMTLLAATGSIMDTDGITNPGWMYQWKHVVGDTTTNISGATSATYLVTDSDIGKAFVVSVSFTDDAMNAEGPLQSGPTQAVGPIDLIVWNTTLDTAFRNTSTLSATTPKVAQSFVSSSSAETYTLDHIELIFGSIGDTATVSDNLTVTLNKNDSGDPGDVLCTLKNPTTFSSSGPHKFHAPAATDGTSGFCPDLTASNTYHVVVEMDSSYTETISITTYLYNPGAELGTAHGWTMPNDGQSYTSSAWANNENTPFLIDVRARPDFELAALTETEVPFGWSLTPEGTDSGEKFRLLFLTDDESPTSTDINVYNEFVQAQAAAGHDDIQEHAGQFRILGSTAADDARDNTETTSSDTDAPIYWLNGAKVADNYADLYDESWDEESTLRDADGNAVSSSDTYIIWTGSDDDGTGRTETAVSVALGETSVRQGELDNSSSTQDPLSATTVTAATNTAPFYALSGIFVVEPNNEATGELSPKTNGPRVDDVLYTQGRGTIADPEGITNAEFTYQWKRYNPVTGTETDIEGATGDPYTVRTADAEHQLRFSISFTDDYNNQEVILSEYTPPVVPSDVLVRIEYDHDRVDSPLNSTNERYAQKFNTGFAGNGYTIDSIGFYFAQIDAPSTAAQHLRVTLNKDDQGSPGAAICTLKDPASFSAPGMNYFTSFETTGRCRTLERNTDYHAVIHRAVTTTDVIAISTTTEDDEANGSASGWTLENTGQVFTQNAWTDIPATRVAVIEVRGTTAREITIPVDSPIIPEGLEGSRFRLMFVTGTTTATEPNMFQYNLDLSDSISDDRSIPNVRDLEDTDTDHMAVLASTADIDARDSTYTTYTSTHKGVPIFWYKGAILADDYEDLYDGTWQNEDKPRNYDGTLVTDLTKEYWTGSDSDGTAKTRGGVSKALGQTEVETGILNHATGDPLSHAADDPTESKSMYAITGIYIIENHLPQGLPSITGVPRVDETLTADTSAITDENGTDRATFTYLWLKVDGANTSPITGATGKTYTPTADLAGKQININVQMTDDRGYKNTFLNLQIDPTEPVVPTEVLVRNTAQTRNATGSDFDNQSPTKMAQSFTTGAEADGYALTSIGIHFKNASPASTASSRITATLYNDSSGEPGDELCTLVDPPTFTSSGLHTFSVPTAGADRCANLAANTTYWIVLENDSSTPNHVTTTNVQDEDAGSLTDWSIADSHHEFSGSFMDWVFSASPILIEVRGVNAVPNITATGVPTISGTAKEGSALTAGTSGIADGNGLGTLKYQWVRVTGTVQTDIDGATASTYTLTEEDLDKTIIVKVSFIDQDGHPEGPLSSAPTGIVTAPDLLVKNTLAGVNAIPTQASDPKIGQAFTTGSSLAGYQLHSLGFRLHAVADPASAGNDLEVTLNEVASSGEPGAALCTLEDPGTFVANSINRFTAPSGDDCPKLSRNTTYFAVLHRVAFTGSNTIAVGTASSPAEDEGSAANWSIANTGYFGAGTTWSASILNYRIEVTGEEGIEVEVPQGWSLTPTGLVGGQKFRLMFVTAAGYSSAETDIEKYNEYVQDQVSFSDAPTDIRAYHTHFRVLGSTADVDARDNTRTNPSDYDSVPIYWMGGDKVADNYGDFYDGSWDSERYAASNGAFSSSARNFWTGSNNDGTESFTAGVSNALGASSVRRGSLNGSGNPLTYFTSTQGTIYGYYALSNIFVVPNSEATGQPAITGTPRVNETLTADTSGITDPEGTDNAVFTYQWIRVDGNDETDIDGATRATYRPKDEDADKKLKVRISFTDNQGFEEGPVTSEPTAFIIARDVLVSNRTPDTRQLDLPSVAAPTQPKGSPLEQKQTDTPWNPLVVQSPLPADLSSVGPKITATIRAERRQWRFPEPRCAR